MTVSLLRERPAPSRRRRSNRPGNSQADEPHNAIHSGKRRHASADGITFSGEKTEGAPIDQRRSWVRCRAKFLLSFNLLQVSVLGGGTLRTLPKPRRPVMTAAAETQSLKRTPLHPLHRELGARMGPFAGYVMPIHYPLGVLKEHLHTRQAAGLFDISHMGQIALHPKTDLGLLVAALERLLPIDVVGLQPGRQRYGFLTNIQGGIIDDCIVANRGDCFLLVVNANRKNVDELHLRTRLVDVGTVEPVSDRALLAVQGPAAETVLARLAPFIKNMRFMDITEVTLAGVTAVVSRSGYTGEDGFEISVPAEQAEKLARLLLQHREVAFIGLGARDSLRTEAGLCLYGADLNEATTPVEAGLEW